ncbi:MAG: 5-(carboxyamino)imidazole ribonucleotide mutase [Candidatus Neomarinimicrobiota bacterium]|jgi:5-(carboxyamino)imidazole ribonucleotide mutase|nr:5-(carboxyamino)imidazole ribonucleotide mutase [Candidatus Neomarinimicrobiota bacterium]|tara:strand:+ start:773 stop:1234 length:462 start_codon:yes stop_codon:yes gene_type:complete
MKKVAILIGSISDKDVVMAAKPYFEYFGIEWELHVSSAHRNPDDVAKFAKNARQNGYGCLIGGAGMAAHLAGALKANSSLPVIGVPMPGGISSGLDALLSTAQMPKGVPVATVAVGKAGAINAAILCAEIFSLTNDELVDKLDFFKKNGCKLK